MCCPAPHTQHKPAHTCAGRLKTAITRAAAPQPACVALAPFTTDHATRAPMNAKPLITHLNADHPSVQPDHHAHGRPCRMRAHASGCMLAPKQARDAGAQLIPARPRYRGRPPRQRPCRAQRRPSGTTPRARSRRLSCPAAPRAQLGPAPRTPRKVKTGGPTSNPRLARQTLACWEPVCPAAPRAPWGPAPQQRAPARTGVGLGVDRFVLKGSACKDTQGLGQHV